MADMIDAQIDVFSFQIHFFSFDFWHLKWLTGIYALYSLVYGYNSRKIPFTFLLVNYCCSKYQ